MMQSPVPSSRRPQIAGDCTLDGPFRLTNKLAGPLSTSQGREQASQPPLPRLPTKPYRMAIAEFLSDIMIFLYAFFSLALLLPRAAVPGAGARPPRRAALALLPLVLRTRTTPLLFAI